MSDGRLTEMLHWAIANSQAGQGDNTAPSESNALTNSQELSTNRTEADEKLRKEALQSILGHPDSEKMKESMTAIMDASLSIADRIIACDNLELLVESLDNAILLKRLGLLPKLAQCLQDIEPEIRLYAAWILGTSSHNSEVVSKEIYESGVLSILLNLLENDKDIEVRSKALYAISSLVKQQIDAREQFEALQGYRILANVAISGDLVLQRKAVFTMMSLSMSNIDIYRIMQDYHLIDMLLKLLLHNDREIIEKTLQWLSCMVNDSRVTGLLLESNIGASVVSLEKRLESLLEDEAYSDIKDDLVFLKSVFNL